VQIVSAATAASFARDADISSVSNCGDKNIPYYSGLSGMNDGVQNWNSTWTDADSPAGASLGTGASYNELDDSFDDYLMYRPPAETYRFRGSIWISLGHFNWHFSSNTSYNGSGWDQPTTVYSTPGPAPILDTQTATPAFPNVC
jgi:hypothetical protein